jgi:hypothetical protein
VDSQEDHAYRVEFRWKEEVIYWESDRGFIFDGGWGISPPVTFVPDGQTWDAVVPSWLRGRREEVVARLAAHPGHVVESTNTGYTHAVAREIFRG